MIDIHNHIVFGVDDGAKTMEDSIRMLEEAAKLNINTMIVTPHFKKGLYDSENITQNFLQVEQKALSMGITLKLGREVFLEPIVTEMIGKDVTPLFMSTSRHMLIEFPFDILPRYAFEILYKLQLENVMPIIAHPERYEFFLKDFNLFAKFIERDCMMQLDAASIIGANGFKAQKFCKKVLKDNLIHFVGSDAHKAEHYVKWYMQAYNKVVKWVGEGNAWLLFHGNAEEILFEDMVDVQ